MKNSLLTLCLLLFCIVSGTAQTAEEFTAEKATLAEQIAALEGQLGPLQARVGEIDKELEILGGWQTGTFGTLGFNLSSFDNWVKGANPTSTSSTVLAAFNGFANKTTSSYFWRNSGNINLGWQKLDIEGQEGSTDFEKIADVLKITSLYGKRINQKLALSALGEFNSALLENFNNPGILDLGVGFTWTPIENAVIVVHPLNYHWVFGDNPDFSSALGAKVVADYTKTFNGGITWRTNLTSFFPYASQDPSLFEYTWTNGLAFSAWKGIGVGIEYAIRRADVEILDTTQNYLIIGLSYAL